MSSEDAGSVTLWIGELKAGEGEAAQKLWRRYFETIVGLARARLRGVSRTAADEEDVRCRRLRQLLRGGQARVLPAAGRPRGPVAAAGHDHRPQGARPG